MPKERIDRFSNAKKLSKKAHIFAFVLIAIIVAVVYANSLKGEFFWDDEGLIKNNFLIKNWNNLAQVFIRPLSDTFYYCYRPLVNLSFMIDYGIWQSNPFGYHLSAITIHALNSFLVYLLIYFLSKDFKLAIATGLIFSVHTVLSEPVNYLSSRADLLMALFCLLSFIFYVIHRNSSSDRSKYYFISLFFFALSLLSKEMAIVLILMLIVYELTISPSKDIIKRRLSLIPPFFVVLIVYAILRFIILKSNPPVNIERFSIAELSLAKRFFTSLTAIPKYLSLLIIPVGLHKEWLIKPVESILEIRVIFSIIFVATFLLLAKQIYRYSKMCAFGIVWFFVLMIPVLNILPLNAFLAEAWLYLPSVGFILFFSALLLKIIPAKTIFNKCALTLSLILILLYFSYLTIKRNEAWVGNHDVFFSDIVKYNPYSTRAYTNLGLIYVGQNNLTKAVEEFQKAIEIDPVDPGLYRNIGNAFIMQNELSLAEKAYKEALRLAPNNAETHGNLGNLYFRQAKHSQAIEEIGRAISINPHNANFHNSLGIVYFSQGRLEEAATEYKKAISLSPDDAKVHTNLGIVYYNQKDLDEAMSEFKESIRLNPNYVDAYFNLGVTYLTLRQFERAKDNLNKTIILSEQQDDKKALAQRAEALLKQMP